MDIKKSVFMRLSTLGYDVKDEDELAIEFLITHIENQIKMFTNLTCVPEGLNYEWIDAVCAAFLKSQLANGKLENVSSIVKNIQEGDTSVTFDDSLTPEKQLIKYLETMALRPHAMCRYRVMLW